MQCSRCGGGTLPLRLGRAAIPHSPLDPAAEPFGGGILSSQVPPKEHEIPYRYATAALHGPWRNTETEALADAIRVGIAVEMDGKLTWRVSARIEKDEGLGALPVWTMPVRNQ